MSRYGRGSIAGIVLEIGADDTGLSQAIDNSFKAASKLEGELKKVNSALRDDPGAGNMKAQKITVLKDAVTATEEKLRQLKTAQEEAAKAVNNGKLSPEKYREIERQVQSTEGRLKNLKKELNNVQSAWIAAGESIENAGKKLKSAGDKMQSIGSTATRTVTAPIAAIGTIATKSAIDFESAMAGVRKTTDLTDQEFSDMSQSIRNMAMEIPSSTTEIAAVAEAAGQLGIEKENILGFTRTIIDLGNASNIVGEEGAAQLAKFANITKMSQTDFDRLGSVIVDLGNNSATTERDIVNMSMRLAGAASQAGLSVPEIMSISAALSSVGLEADAGGTAMSKMLKQIQLAVETSNDDLPEFARVAGMSADEFKLAFEENAVGALSAFISGLSDTERHGKSAVQILDEMGITEVRTSDSLLRLTNAGDLMNQTLEIGNNAWEENTALANEANQRYATTASQLQIAKNKMNDAAITLGQQLIPHVTSLVEWLSDLIQKFNDLTPAQQETIIKIAALAAAFGPTLKVVGSFTSGLGTITTSIGKLSKAIGEGGLITKFLGPVGLIAAVGAAVFGLGKLAYEMDDGIDKVGKWQREFENLNTTMGGQREEYRNNANRALDLIDKIEQLNKVEKLSTEQKLELKAAVKELNGIYPDLDLKIDANTGKLENSTKIIKEYIREYLKMQLAESYADQFTENAKLKAEAIENLATAQDKLNTAQETYKKFRDDPNSDPLVVSNLEGGVRGAEAYVKEAEENVKRVEEAELALVSSIEGIDDEVDKLLGNRLLNYKENSTEITNLLFDEYKEIYQTRKDEQEAEADHNKKINKLSKDRLRIIHDENKERKKTQREIEQAIKDHHDVIFNIENESLVNSDITLWKTISNLQQQTTEYKNWRENLKEVVKRVPADVRQYLQELGPTAAGMIAEMTYASDEEIQIFIDLIRESAALSRTGFYSNFSPLQTDAEETVKHAARRVRGESGNLRKAADETGSAANAGLAEGLTKGRKQVYDNAYTSSRWAIDGLDAGSYGSSTVGRNMIDGLAAGISERTWYSNAMARKAAEDAVYIMNQVTRTRSPSRATMEIGAYMMDGLGIGIRDGISDVVAVSGDAARAALSALRQSVGGLSWQHMGSEFAMPQTTLTQRQTILQVGQLVVREEADVQKVANELDRLAQRRERSLT